MTEQTFPGRRLGLPEAGPGSVAHWGLRILAFLLDWAIASALAFLLVGSAGWDSGTWQAWVPLLVWYLVAASATGLTGASLGQHALRIRVVRLDGKIVGLWRGMVRTALIALVIPPLVYDPDNRGLHDLAVGTVAVRGPSSRAAVE